MPDGVSRVVALELVGLPRAKLDSASARLFELGATGLQEDWLPGEAPAVRQPWDDGPEPAEPERIVLRAWFEPVDAAARTRIERALGGYTRTGATLAWSEEEVRDWEAEYQAGFPPIEVAPGPVGLVIAPPWNAPPGALVIEPGQGFGTGHHPTTVQALRLLWALDAVHRTALDVGCGSGILALAAAKRGMIATGIDVEEAAIRDAERNAAANGLDARFSTEPLAAIPGRFDVVVANLHAELIVALGPELARRVGRTLILAGILGDREAMARNAVGPGFAVTARDVDGEWIALQLERTRTAP